MEGLSEEDQLHQAIALSLGQPDSSAGPSDANATATASASGASTSAAASNSSQVGCVELVTT